MSDAADAALEALGRLVAETLDGKSPERFAVASRICNIGNALVRECAVRVADLPEPGDRVGDLNVQRANALNAVPAVRYQAADAVVGGGHYYGPNDQANLLRESMMSILPRLNAAEEASRAATAKDESLELATLIELTKTPLSDDHATTVAARIDRLFQSMEARNAMVSPDDVRRHPTQGPGAEANPAPRLPVDADGGEGDGGAPGAGAINGAH